MKLPTAVRLSALLALAALAADAARAEDASCDCGSQFDAVVSRVEADYAGFRHKAAGRPGYPMLVEALRQRASEARDHRSCVDLVEAYLEHFHDRHLFVFNLGDGDAPPAEALQPLADAGSPPADPAPEGANPGNASPSSPGLSGIWYDHHGMAHMRRSSSGGWVAHRPADGDAPATAVLVIEAAAEGRMRARWRDDSGRWQRTRASLHRNGELLLVGPTAWHRRAPETEGGDPLAPTLRFHGDRAAVLDLPSFDPRHAAPLAALVEANASRIEALDTLVIDLRGNGGGSLITNPLGKYLLDGPIQVGMQGEVLASAANIEILGKLRERYGDAGAFLDPVLERMRAAPGTLVDHVAPRSYTPPEIAPGPARVVLVLDRGVASAAESFVLLAGQSGRVTSIGEPTAGVIDYQQAQIVRVGCPDGGLAVGYPLYTRSKRLPDDALDASGIAPDIHLPLDRIDPIDFALGLSAAKVNAEQP